MDVVHGVGLYRCRLRPAEAELSKTALHLAGGEADFLPPRAGAEIAVTNDAVGVAGSATAGFGAARDHEGRRRARAGPRERERVKRRLGRRIDLGTDIAARHRIDGAVEQAPFGE